MQSINNAEQLDNNSDEGLYINSDPSTQSLLTAGESAKPLSDAVIATQ